MRAIDRFRMLAHIRSFEARLVDLFRKGAVSGTTHTSLGQEAIAVAMGRFLGAKDLVFSNHRCHAHFIASGGRPEDLLLEILGKPSGLCAGYGGSQHLYDGRFYSNGIQGGMVPVAAGAGLAERLHGSGAVCVSFIGDGTLGQGVVYEALNIASLWSLPLLLVVEANGIAQTTPTERHLAGSMRKRFEAFGIAVGEVASNSLDVLDGAFEAAFAHVREQSAPYALIVHTARLGPHSKGDDFRDPEDIKRYWQQDPLALAAALLPEGVAERVVAEEEALTAELFKVATAAMSIAPAMVPVLDEVAVNGTDPCRWRPIDSLPYAGRRINEAIGQSLARKMSADDRIHLIGEDILDPGGGAFAVYRGLSTAYPQRVHTTPIAEAGIVGVANGMALRGLRPVVEIMFGDFLSLAMDQILNHATKFPQMYGPGAPGCPVIVRTPMGGYRGYGPTHSQSLEKHFLGVPGLVTTALSPVHDIDGLWDAMLACDRPVLHVENKVLYGNSVPALSAGRVDGFALSLSQGNFPTARLRLRDGAKPAPVAVITYGGLVATAMAAAKELFIQEELDIELVVPSLLSPLPMRDIRSAVSEAAVVVVLEEGTGAFGWGAEVAARLMAAPPATPLKVLRLAAADAAIPNAPALEKAVLPSVNQLVETILKAVR